MRSCVWVRTGVRPAGPAGRSHYWHGHGGRERRLEDRKESADGRLIGVYVHVENFGLVCGHVAEIIALGAQCLLVE